jgi:hypothetical protein
LVIAEPPSDPAVKATDNCESDPVTEVMVGAAGRAPVARSEMTLAAAEAVDAT